MKTTALGLLLALGAGACEPPSTPPPLAGGGRDTIVSVVDGTSPADTTVSVPDVTQPTAGGPFDVARAALDAWKRSDVSALQQLSPDAASLAQVTSDPARMAAMFGAQSWRAQAVAAWNGTFGAMRVQGERALIELATLDDGRVVLVDLRQEASGWRFVGLERASRLAFDAFGSPVLP